MRFDEKHEQTLSEEVGRRTSQSSFFPIKQRRILATPSAEKSETGSRVSLPIQKCSDTTPLPLPELLAMIKPEKEKAKRGSTQKITLISPSKPTGLIDSKKRGFQKILITWQ